VRSLARRAINLLMICAIEQNPYQGDKTGVVDRAMIVCPVTLIKVRLFRLCRDFPS
jgi:hypothetical protein